MVRTKVTNLLVKFQIFVFETLKKLKIHKEVRWHIRNVQISINKGHILCITTKKRGVAFQSLNNNIIKLVSGRGVVVQTGVSTGETRQGNVALKFSKLLWRHYILGACSSLTTKRESVESLLRRDYLDLNQFKPIYRNVVFIKIKYF